MDGVNPGKMVRDLRQHMRSNIHDLTAQLPTLEYKAQNVNVFGSGKLPGVCG